MPTVITVIKRFYLLTVMIALVACSGSDTDAGSDLESLYKQLDNEIAQSGDYDSIKEKRIAELRRQYNKTLDAGVRTDIFNALIEEFNSYNADSALFYVSCNLRRPEGTARPGEYTRLLIKRADIFAHAGLFADALSTIESIPRDSLTDDLRESYYSTYCALYQYLSEYNHDHETADKYEKLRTAYTDTLNSLIKPGTFNYLIYIMSEKAREGHYEEAIANLTSHINDYKQGTREYSILASTLAYIYLISGDDEDHRRYLVLSAISDVRGAVKENMSFRGVATLMFEDGDTERANRYLKKSIADANFYSAMMRNAQSSKLLPVIDEAYVSVQQQLTGRLRTMVWLTSILSCVLIVTVILIMRQYKSLHLANKRVNSANSELNKLSEMLKEANDELEQSNLELIEYNRTKEEYAGLFMEYCSSAISTLKRYQLSLRNLLAQGVNRDSLRKKIESTDIADQMLKTFYGRFDEAILSIYPQFVEKFNALLKPDERIVLKSEELLNTELRLYALIRIGINDNNQIAEFLRCSISTVYTYRSKIRRRALNPEEFEVQVSRIN